MTVDTGGTKTLITSFNEDGSTGEMIKFPTPKNQGDYVARIYKTLQEHYSDKDVEAVVIALPGIIKNGVALWCHNLKWRNFRAQEAFDGVLGDAPVLLENDANLAGLAETRLLDTIPTSSLYVTVSTGIGTAVISNGHIDPGMRHSEGGHALVEFDGSVREWESFASGQAIRTTYGKYARDITNPRTWKQIADRISRGFLAVIPIIQPDIIIIGGSMGTYFEKFGPQLEALLREKLPPYIPCPKVVQAKNPEEAVIYGCYYYALDTLAS